MYMMYGMNIMYFFITLITLVIPTNTAVVRTLVSAVVTALSKVLGVPKDRKMSTRLGAFASLPSSYRNDFICPSVLLYARINSCTSKVIFINSDWRNLQQLSFRSDNFNDHCNKSVSIFFELIFVSASNGDKRLRKLIFNFDLDEYKYPLRHHLQHKYCFSGFVM
jgi:hypothetical protein